MSEFSSTLGSRVRRVFCPNCRILANRFTSMTELNQRRVFHKCPYFAVGGCQFWQWEDEMEASADIGGPSAQPIPLQAVAAGAGVPLQARAVGAAIPPTPAIMQQGSQATQAGGGLVQDRVEISATCTQIMRLVNGFVENPYKKTGLSISELAEAVGIPRVLVDIRHESSHRSLPSLRLLHLASIKAFDWLKCIYWDRQANSIPDAQLELRLRLHEIAGFLKENNSKESKSGSKRKRSEKLISKAMKYARRLYYACPSEVVSVLLDLMELDAADSESIDMEETDSLAVNHSSDIQLSNSDMKTIILKLSEKEPRLLLSVLKSVIEMIDAKEELTDKGEYYSWQPVGPSKVKRLCSLVLWLVTNIKELKDSGYIGLIHEIGVLSSDKNAIPRFCLAKLLQKLLNLSTIGESCLIDAALLLIEMVNDNNVKEKLRKLPVLCLGRLARSSSLSESRTIRNQQESVENATETLELFKVQLKRQKNGTTEGSFNTSTPEKHDRWSVAKSWTPCPIGTVPCSFSSCAVLPAFDVISHEQVSALEHETFEEVNHSERFEPQTEELEDESILEIPRSSPEYEISDVTELICPLKGRLLVGGVWKMVAEEELLLIKSKMKILL